MKFSLLLFGLFQLLRGASLVHGPFKKFIKYTKLRLVIKTRDNKWGRLFVFDKGTVRSERGAHHGFDVALVFKDTKAGYSVLSDRESDAIFNAAARGDVHLEGMNVWAVWFEEAMGLLV